MRYTSFWKLLLITLLFIIPVQIIAQCPGGYTTSKLDWDTRAYVHRAFLTDPYVTAAMAQNQYFTMGYTRVNFTSTHASTTSATTNGILGVDTLHTGETGSFGTRYDMHYKFNGTITITFDAPVSNVKFSVYDIDYNQTVTVTSANGASAVPVEMTKISGTNLTITPVTMPANTVVAKAGATNAIALNSSDGTANVSIAGPLTSITIAMTTTGTRTSGSASSQEDGSTWLSDIEACILNTAFPANYHAPYTRPFTGQPSYFLSSHAQDSTVYVINSSTGVADMLFVDPFLGGTTYGHANSLAYDPINKIVYYIRSNSSLTGAGYKTVMKYDVNTETISVAIPDLNVLGIPVGISGINGTSAAFYDGALYLGIEVFESCNCPNISGVWRIDFDGSLNAIKASMVYAKPNGQYFAGGSAGPNEMYNWGDISIKDGILYSQTTYTTTSVNAQAMVHFNLLTGAATEYKDYVITDGSQLGQTWDGKIFSVWNSIKEYNGAGGWIAGATIVANSCSPYYDIVSFGGGSSDASDPFKPKADFGDAPASYDPDPLSPAVHEKACNNSLLRLGATWDREWSKTASANASADASDEDGISAVTPLISTGIAYNHIQSVSVFNNTGANATLAGWLDYNANGLFEASEGRVVTVPSNAAPQNITLAWNGLTIPIGRPATFLRIRLVSSLNTMTTSNATGWYNEGEVEDYPVASSGIALSSAVLNLLVKNVNNEKVSLNWNYRNDGFTNGFNIQKSSDNRNWITINNTSIKTQNESTYAFDDNEPLNGRTYYRLQILKNDNTVFYSEIKAISISKDVSNIKIFPNPATAYTNISFNSDFNLAASVFVKTTSGQVLQNIKININQGLNSIPVPVTGLKPGVYIVELSTSIQKSIAKLIVY